MKVEVNNAQQTEQVDWTKNPQLVHCNEIILLVLEDQQKATSENTFVGLRLDNHDFDNCWDKEDFKPFHGSITLSNDKP